MNKETFIAEESIEDLENEDLEDEEGDWYWDGCYDSYIDALIAHDRLGFPVCY